MLAFHDFFKHFLAVPGSMRGPLRSEVKPIPPSSFRSKLESLNHWITRKPLKFLRQGVFCSTITVKLTCETSHIWCAFCVWVLVKHCGSNRKTNENERLCAHRALIGSSPLACMLERFKADRGGGSLSERGAQGAQVHSKGTMGLRKLWVANWKVLQPIWLVTAAYLTFWLVLEPEVEAEIREAGRYWPSPGRLGLAEFCWHI